MHRIQGMLLSALLVVALLAGCKEDEIQTIVPQDGQPLEAPAAVQSGRSGTVTETANASGYTYVQVDAGDDTFWAAAPAFAVEVGDRVSMPAGMAMTDFRSEALDRTFDVVYFVEAVRVGDAPAAGNVPAGGMPAGHPDVGGQDAPAGVDVSDVEKAAGGYTVGELFAGKDDLAGETVTVRGKVVKYNAQIMGRNWIHIQDGTGAEGANDLTISTAATARVGDTIVATGVLSTDKDFGYGYTYPLIIEDGQVTVE